MTNYAPLIAVWNATGLPTGVSGTPLAAGMTAAQKLAAIVAWTVVVPAQAVFSSTQVDNLITPAEYASLSESQDLELQSLFVMGQIDVSKTTGANTRGQSQAILAGSPNSLAAFNAELVPYDTATQLWTVQNGLPQYLDSGDLSNAGLS